MRLSARYYMLAALCVLLFSGGAALWAHTTISQNLERSLLAQATTVTYALDTTPVSSLSGSTEDLALPQYHALKERLMKIRAANPDIRFVYITGYREGEPFFYVDSEPENSEDYSPPGQVYEEGTDPFRDPFVNNDPTPIMEGISSDRWGTWLTALTPMVDPATNHVTALVGMDMNASQYYQTVYLYTLLPVIIGTLIMLLLVIGYLIRKREQKLLDFKAELVSIASHELRAPLTSMSWLAESMLKNAGSLSAEQRAGIGTIESQSRELLLMVNNFLDLATIENATTQPAFTSVSPYALIEELSVSFRTALVAASLQLMLDPSLRDVQVLGDAARLKRLFANLLSNAIKYSRAGGTITVSAQKDAAHVTIRIKDEGIGIPAQDQKKIFGGYYRATNAKDYTEHGTGLGLRYVEQIAALHHSRVWVESEEGKGSTFFVELPA